MHELAICQGLISEVERVARANGAEAVSRITVAIGPLSGIVPELLRGAYEIARTGTMAGRASLFIEQTEPRVHCDSCGVESEAAPNRLLCAACGEWRVQVVSGDEMLLKSVELMRAEAHGAEI